MSQKSSNAVLVGVGIAAIAAFFMPFLDLGGLVSASGWEILVADHVPWSTRLVLLALPVSGLALVGAGATGSKSARLLGVGFGLGVFGYLGYQMVKLFVATTGFGLWLTLIAAAVAIVAGLATRSR